MMAVARHAGVSHQTVSRVLNDPEKVRPETRERVQAAMRELGYSRNMAARALVTQQSELIGVLWTGGSYFGPAGTVGGIEFAARAAGYSCLVGALEEFDADEVRSLVGMFLDRGVDGIAVVAPTGKVATIAVEQAGPVPLVLVADVPADAGAATVAVDQELGARMVTAHMIGRGCRRILHVSGPSGWFDAGARVRGWRVALADAGLAEAGVVEGDWSPERGYEIGRDLVAAGNLPDGIFCANDPTAIGLLAALREAGVDVPGEVSVAGFDDISGAAFLAPPLTSVAQPFGELGRRALEVLVGVIRGEPPAVHRLRPELRVRASVR